MKRAIVAAAVVVFLATCSGIYGQDMSMRVRAGPYVYSSPIGALDVSSSLSVNCSVAYVRLISNPAAFERMVDAMGKPGAGILEYGAHWYGDFLECESVPQARFCISSFSANISGTSFPIQWGVCIPKECTASDAGLLLFHLEDVLPLPPITAFSNFLDKYEVSNSSYGFCNEPTKWSTSSIITITFITLILAFLATGTFVDWYFYGEASGPYVRVRTVNVENGDSKEPVNGFGGEEVGRLTVPSSMESTPLLSNPGKATYNGSRAMHRAADLLRCFSVPRKLSIILAATHKPGTIPCLHGLRVLSMFWVILGHTYVWPLMMFEEDNMLEAIKTVKRFSFQFIANGTLSVDTFFFLSGLLVMYLTLKHLDGNGGRLKWYMFYLHRFLRLTPLYMFLILFVTYIVPFFGTGPTWSVSWAGMTKACKDYWYTNLLYINNFYPHKMNDQCIGWSWYLANDMQFFIISPVVIIAAYRFRQFGMLIAVSILCLVSIISSGVLVGVYNFMASAATLGTMTGVVDGITYSSQDVLYEKPYVRISTYAVGLAVGYYLRRMPDMRKSVPKCWKKRLPMMIGAWLVSGVLLCLPLYSLYHMNNTNGTLTLAETVLHTMFSRFCWGLGLAALVVICHCELGGYVNSFLSHPLWIPLSRLTYAAYLVHPIILTIMYLGLDQGVYFTDSAMVFFYLAAVLGSYVVALIFSVGVEYPLLELENQVVGR